MLSTTLMGISEKSANMTRDNIRGGERRRGKNGSKISSSHTGWILVQLTTMKATNKKTRERKATLWLHSGLERV